MNRNFGGMGMGGMNRPANMMGMGQMGGAGMGILGNAPRSGGMQMGGGINQQMMQQQMMRDSQLQIVSNLLQQQNQQQQVNMHMMGNQGMLGNMQGMRGMGGIPSLLDMRSKLGMGSMFGQKRGMMPMGPSDYKRMRRNRPPSPMGRRNYRNQDDRRHSRRSSRSPVRSWRDHSPDSRSRRDTERSGSSLARSDGSSDMKDKEEYDPAKPTEDVEQVGDGEHKVQSESGNSEKKDDNLGDLKVTVRDDERSVNRGGARRRKSFDEGDEKKTNFYCHACKRECFQQQNFARHMTGVQHRNTMDKLMNVHIAKSSQLEARMKAEEHLRSIDGKGRSRQHYNSSRDQRSRGQRRSRFDNEDCSEELNEMVTVDTVGYEDDESRSERKPVISEQDLIIPDYDSNTPCGQKYVIAVTGFFCKLCHKFYNNETAAKVTHCQSESHYEHYHKAMTVKVAKLRDLMEQKRKEDEEKKQKEEEEKKQKEEEEKKQKEDDEEKKQKEEDEEKKQKEEVKEQPEIKEEEKEMELVEEITLGSPDQEIEDEEEKALLADDDKDEKELEAGSKSTDAQATSIPGLDLLKETGGDEQRSSVDGNEKDIVDEADVNEDNADKVENIADETLSTDSEVVETTDIKSKARGGGKPKSRRGRRGKN